MVPASREIEHAVRSLREQAETTFDPEFLQALRICDVTPALDGALTFLPAVADCAGQWDRSWTGWLEGFFTGVAAPALLLATEHARAGRGRELLELDAGLAKSFDEATLRRSAGAGERILKRLSAARGVRWLDRLQAAVASGATPGNFLVAYACQGALFHLNPRAVLGTCAYWEWIAAAAVTRYRPLHPGSVFQEGSAPVLQRITEKWLFSPAIRTDEPSRASL